ncbi:MAG: phage integrase N-terminal SAM-like domain-containing protein [Campylobacterota bacterium]|nr:phage integrase N-terminal SAM-like domain-containing protein [Campylobacterota bacterium]
MKKKRKLFDQVRDKIQMKHYSIKTERSYVSWIKRYIMYHDKRHPIEMQKMEIEQFLTFLTLRIHSTGLSLKLAPFQSKTLRWRKRQRQQFGRSY